MSSAASTPFAKVEFTLRLCFRQLVVPWLRGMAVGRPSLATRLLFRHTKALFCDRLWPSETRIFRNHREEVKALRAKLYLQIEHQRHLRPYRASIEAIGLHDKGQFSQFCDQHALPHPATAVLAGRNPADTIKALNQIGGREFIVKPAIGSSGHGLALLRREDEASWKLVTGREPERQASNAEALLASHCPGRDLVLQPMLHNAPNLAKWVGKSLATFRTVTVCEGGGKIAVLSMLAELPLDETEPMTRAWALLPVDLSTGALARMRIDLPEGLSAEATARARGYDGQKIEAVAAMANLATKTHQALVEMEVCSLPPLVGWDIVLTPDGPMVLELNWNWAIAPHYCNMGGLDFDLSERFSAIAQSVAVNRN